MIKKIIYFLIFLFAVSCGKNTNNSTSPINSQKLSYDYNTQLYTDKGIADKYNGVWKFFNVDETGNKSSDVVINDGSINYLIVSNKNIKINFNKENIYSQKEEKNNLYYDRYFGYIISDVNWVGEIHFPTYDDETVAYVYIKNKKSSDIIAGMLDKAPGPKDGIDRGFFGKISRTDNGLKRTVDIQGDFVSYYENDNLKLKVPSKFFDLSKGDGFYGYTIILGLLYPGISINVYNSKNVSILPSVYFEYIDYNYQLDIKLKDDGVPISARYDKKVKVISPGDILYAKEN